VPDHYIVALRPGAAPATVAARHGLAPTFVYNAAMNGFAGFVPPGILRKLLTDPQVASVVPDREVVAFGKPVKPPPTPQPEVLPAGVSRVGGPIAVAGVGVAVVDTGLDMNHKDLLVSPECYTAIVRTTGMDDNGHGTHVGGIIAAIDNEIDVVGVAPGATLYAVKVLNRRGSGTDSTVIAGLDWIADNYNLVTPNIRVVNMSLGRPGTLTDQPAYRAAIQTLTESCSITVVVAAGNDCNAEVSEMVPACYPEVIAVASTAACDGASTYPGFSGIPKDTASFFTTDGAEVCVSAPGEEREDVSADASITSIGILSTKLGGGTTRMSGTSMAAPHVAGVSAVIYAAGIQATPDGVRRQITADADGAGRVPQPSPTECYTPDGFLEGVVQVPSN